ncbi:amphinase-3-like [Synchiropus splendidus]|uniref:amphinase-3-like n=1 Tax=Synchiropus splendidus TaxID=270530 RepID=UPI00237E056C|nr:amphinase-3-like [Synchiropus splendidus]
MFYFNPWAFFRAGLSQSNSSLVYSQVTQDSTIDLSMNVRFTLVLLLLPLLVMAVLSLDADRGTFRGFKKNHIYEGTSPLRCTQEIKKRKIKDKNGCKPVNTFILADSNKVKSICNRDGDVESREMFKVVKCTLDRKSKSKSNCQYNQRTMRKKITVTCENGEPVHMVRSAKWLGYQPLE